MQSNGVKNRWMSEKQEQIISSLLEEINCRIWETSVRRLKRNPMKKPKIDRPLVLFDSLATSVKTVIFRQILLSSLSLLCLDRVEKKSRAERISPDIKQCAMHKSISLFFSKEIESRQERKVPLAVPNWRRKTNSSSSFFFPPFVIDFFLVSSNFWKNSSTSYATRLRHSYFVSLFFSLHLEIFLLLLRLRLARTIASIRGCREQKNTYDWSIDHRSCSICLETTVHLSYRRMSPVQIKATRIVHMIWTSLIRRPHHIIYFRILLLLSLYFRSYRYSVSVLWSSDHCNVPKRINAWRILHLDEIHCSMMIVKEHRRRHVSMNRWNSSMIERRVFFYSVNLRFEKDMYWFQSIKNEFDQVDRKNGCVKYCREVSESNRWSAWVISDWMARINSSKSKRKRSWRSIRFRFGKDSRIMQRFVFLVFSLLVVVVIGMISP